MKILLEMSGAEQSLTNLTHTNLLLRKQLLSVKQRDAQCSIQFVEVRCYFHTKTSLQIRVLQRKKLA